MIGMTLRVTMLNGEEHEAPVTYGVASRWEDQHPQTSVSKFLEDMKFKQLAWLAWDALRTKKITVKVFPQFLDEVEDITFIPKAEGKSEGATNLIAQLAVRTGISPLDLMETPPQIIDEMIRLIVEQNEKN